MKIIEAAGAVVLRRPVGREPEVLMVHRPRYDDWSLPKGKLEPYETAPEAAVREVEEESSATITLRAPLDRTSRSMDGGEKQISWWQGIETVDHGRGDTDLDHDQPQLQHPDEVDQIDWLPVSEAPARLTYEQDHHLLTQALDQPATTPLIIVRHAKAINRKDWQGSDAARPLRARGRMQSRRLIPLLSAYGVRELITSPWTRCLATMQPYALDNKIIQQRAEILSEEAAEADPGAVLKLIDEIRERTVVEQQPTAVCCHRPVLPGILEALELPDPKLATAECLVVHLTDTAEVHAVERHRPRA